MVAAIFHHCGAVGGLWKDTPKCLMFEDMYFRSVNVRLLRDVSPDRETEVTGIVHDCRGFPGPVTEDWLRDEFLRRYARYNPHHRPIFFKDCRMTANWRAWDRAFPRATWIVTRRNLISIVRSCMKTSYMNLYEDEKGWTQWMYREYLNPFIEMKKALGDRYVEVWPSRFVYGSTQFLETVIQSCGLAWNPESVVEFTREFN